MQKLLTLFLVLAFFIPAQAQKMELEKDQTTIHIQNPKVEFQRGGKYHDSGSWEKTLLQKAIFFDENTRERHNIEGTYPSSVRLRPPTRFYNGDQTNAWEYINKTGKLPQGWFIDHGTTGRSNVAHTSSWTGNLITAQAFQVAALRKHQGELSTEFKSAYERANEIIAGIRILTLASGEPGYLVRGYAFGHGPSYSERQYRYGENGERDLWKQGVGEYSYLRYRGGPSHHNYDQVFRGLGIYYFLAADDKQKEAIREIVEDMSNWAHLKNNMLVMLENAEDISTELIGGWRALDGTARPSGSSIMATTGLKIAYMITGNKEVEALYKKWTDALAYRQYKDSDESFMGEERVNYDDTDHLLPDLYLLNLIEEDPDLLAFYRKCVKDSWEVHKKDKQAWFSYIYQAVLGDEYGDKEGSIWNLQTFPTNRILQPQMNSIRDDIEFITVNGKKQSLHPLPVYARPSDNEYEWKASPYALDGWFSRTVKQIEILPYDNHIQFAIEANGSLYRSFTNGEVWEKIENISGVRDIVMFPDHRWLLVVATKDGIYRSFNCGSNWEKCSDTILNEIHQDMNQPNVVYGLSDKGIYQCNNFGEWGAGSSWVNISGEVPPLPAKNFAIQLIDEDIHMYLQTTDGLFIKKGINAAWTPPQVAKRGRGFSELTTFPGKPVWTKVHGNRIFTSIEIREWAFQGNIVLVSEDEGKNWTPVIKSVDPLYKWMVSAKDGVSLPMENLKMLLGALIQVPIEKVLVDENDPDVWYGLTANGIAITKDAGESWTLTSNGMYIPRAQTLFKPRFSNHLYASTPAGVYKSTDQAQSWEDTSLILQDIGALRAEIGGVGYLEAYWLGRLHGFINNEEAKRVWWK